MTQCDRYRDLLMRRFDRDLEGHGREALDEHLDSCPRCRALSRDLTRILGTLERTAAVEPDADLERLVLDRIMSLPALSERGRDMLPKAVFATLAGLAVLLFLVLGLSLAGMGYLDLVLAARDYADRSSALLVNVQIACDLVWGLFSADLLEASRKVLAVSVLTMTALLLAGVKAALARPAAGSPD